MSDLTDEDDGIHPLDRDYVNPVPSPPKRFIFTKSRGLNLGILGFGVGGFILLIGIVLGFVMGKRAGKVDGRDEYIAAGHDDDLL